MSGTPNLDKFCVRCGSEVGYDEERPNFCTVCWDTRRPVPRQFRALAARAERLTALVEKQLAYQRGEAEMGVPEWEWAAALGGAAVVGEGGCGCLTGA